MSKSPDLDILLVGKTGNGKSATGNSILRQKAFRSSSSTTSVTSHLQFGVTEFNGRFIEVMDGPGVRDTRLNSLSAARLAKSALVRAMQANSRGYHAFLIVVRFGGKFTKEGQDTVVFLKIIFGENFLRNYCIIVMTCGDNFEQDSEETGLSFKNWCREQNGAFADLMRECNNRIVLFDNETKDYRKMDAQMSYLITLIDNLRFRGRRYTYEEFRRVNYKNIGVQCDLGKR